LESGPAAIEAVLKTKPEAYLKVVASLLPKDVNLNVRPPPGSSRLCRLAMSPTCS
jgi:hypothetical protein